MTRTRIAIRDKFGNIQKLEELRQALNSIPDIAKKGLRMYNQIKLRGDTFLIMDFAIEVDDSVEGKVKEAIQAAGFILRGTPLLDRPGVQEAVRNLVEYHCQDSKESQLKYAVWFRLEDPEDVHLLEISENVFDPGSATLEGVAMNAGDAVPGARAIVVYLASPGEFKRAIDVNKGHPAVLAVLEKNAILVHPDKQWDMLFAEFGIKANGRE